LRHLVGNSALGVLLVICLCLPSRTQAGWKRHVIDDSSRGADGVRLTDINGDGRLDIATGWEQGGAVRICLNPGPERAREKWPAVTVGRAGDVEDAVFADLDADGAMDVVSCSEGRTRLISVHWAPRDRARLLDADTWHTEALPASANKMMWMFALPLQLNDHRDVDLVAGGKGAGAAIGWFESPAKARQLADWKWHELRPVGWLMSLVASDMDGDGDMDVVYSDRKGKRSGAYWLENPGADAAQMPWREHAIGGQGTEAMFMHLADLDQDGLEDVLLAVKPQEILWFRRENPTGQSWQSHSIPLPANTGTAKAVNVADLDRDGKQDLLFSCENARAPWHGLMWLSSDDQPQAGKWTPHELSGADGVKHDLIAAVDLDDDGDLDVVTTEEVNNLGVIWYENPCQVQGRAKPSGQP
jgi:hypothetical protein